MRLLAIILLGFLWCNLSAQVDPEQIYQAPGRDYVLLSTDTLNSSYPINGIYVPTKLRDSIYFKSDSVCIGIFGDGRPDPCVFIPTGGGGPSDTLYYWIFRINGGSPDTIIMGEQIDLIAGTNISITGSTDNPTINALVDTCIHTLSQLTDTTAALLDCNGVNRGIITFSSDECIQDMVVSNGIGSDTIFLTDCDGINKDTVVFYPPNVNDMRLDSIGLFAGDTIKFYMRDTGGIYDTLYAIIPQDSIDTDSQSLTYVYDGQFDTIGITRGNEIYLFDQDSQSFAIDTTTALFTLSRDPTTTPDLLVLPWKDAIRDDYSANYTDSIRHEGYVGINTSPIYPLDVQSNDVFNTIQGRFTNPYSGVSSIRLERAGDGVQYDLMNWGSSFDLRRLDVGGSGAQFMRLDTSVTGRLQHYIWHDDEGYFWLTDYGRGYHVPTDPEDSVKYLLAPRDDGRFLEIPFSDVLDSLVQIGIPQDTVPDYDWLTIGGNRVPDQPDDIDSSIWTKNRVHIGDSTFATAKLTVSGIETDTTLHLITTDTTNIQIITMPLADYTHAYADGNSASYGYHFHQTYPQQGYNFFIEGGYTGTSGHILNLMANGDLSMKHYRSSRDDMPTAAQLSKIFYPGDTTYANIGANGVLRLASIDTLMQALINTDRVHDYDFVMLVGDSCFNCTTRKDTLIPHLVTDLDSLVWRPGNVRLGDTMFVSPGYDTTLFSPHVDSIYRAVIQIPNRFIGLDMYRQDSLYPAIFRTDRSDWWFRIQNEESFDTLPSYFDIGAISWYDSTGTTYEKDTSNRRIFRISSQSNEGAFEIHRGSIKLGDYTPDDIDTSINPIDILAMYVPKPDGTIALTSLDTIGAAIGIAVSTPDITMHERYNETDSIALNLNASGDTAFADLSWLKAYVSNDTLYQGEEFYVLPADSLGTAGNADEIVIRSGGRGAQSYSGFVYNGSSLGVNNASPTNAATITGTATLELILQATSGNPDMAFAEGGDVKAQWKYDVTGHALSAYVDESNSGLGGIGPSDFSIYDDGYLQANAYGGGLLTGTPTRYAAWDASGYFIERTTAQVLSDIGAQPSGSYDNYQSFTVSAASGTPELITSGENLAFIGDGGDITTSISTGDVHLSIPSNAIQSDEISNGEVYPVDMAMPAPGAGQDEYVLTYEHTGGVWELVSPSTYTANQTITLTGDVTGSGATTIGATIANNAVSEPKLLISNSPTSGYFLRWNGSGMEWATATAAGDELGSTGNQNGNIVFMNAASNLVVQDNDFYWDNGSNTLNLDDLVLSGNTDGTQNITSTEGLSIAAASGNMIIGSSGITLINDDALIGGNTSDQLAIATTTNSVAIGHEAVSNRINFNESSNTITIGTGSGFDRALIISGNQLIGAASVGSSAGYNLVIGVGSTPASSPINAISLYASDVASSAELFVRDEASNVTTLSPHNFSQIPEGPSEEMAWAFYSERDGQYINVDMLKLARLIEQLTGEKLVYTGKLKK